MPGSRVRAGDTRLGKTGRTLSQGAFGLSEETDTLMALATQFWRGYGSTGVLNTDLEESAMQ